jgi:hypothetical protein
MSTATKILILTALTCAASGPVAAQPPSPPAATDATTAAPSAKPTKPSAQSEAGDPRADTSTAQPPAPARALPAPKASPKSAPKIDRLELGTATVTGEREQPKVMYIVPWKRSDIGDLTARPMNSLVDEILAPVDRDVFKREVVYYHAVQSDTSQNGAPPRPAQQGEK